MKEKIMKKRKVFTLILFLLVATVGIGRTTVIDVNASTNKENQVSKIALGETHSAAIEEDGTLWMWGNNRDNQVNSDISQKEVLTPLKVMTDVKAVSLGSVNSAAIKRDNSLWIWGTTILDDLNKYSASERSKPHKIMENVSYVSLGGSTGAAIKEDRSLWMWGSNWYGQIGDGTRTNCEKPKKIMDDVKSISLGSDYSAAIKEDGSLWMWGQNSNGKLGDGTTERSLYPKKIMENVKSVELSCWNHSAAIKKDGSLWMWGWNGDWQLGDGTFNESHQPKKIMENVKSVSLGHSHSGVVKEDGTLWMWGENYSGQIGSDNLNMDVCNPKEIKMQEGEKVKDVQLSDGYTAFIKNDNTLWMMGRNNYGQLGVGTLINVHDAEKILFFRDSNEYFELGKDSNHFYNYRTCYKITNEKYKEQLKKDCNFLEKGLMNLKMTFGKGGTCHGIALSMCLGTDNYVDFNQITPGAVNYWTMGNSLEENIPLREMVLYYHLTQFTEKGKATAEINKKDLDGKKHSLSKFLERFIEEAKLSQKEKKPFVFRFAHEEDGIFHSVVVCGYHQDEKGNHVIKIYDENSYEDGNPGDYLKMIVNSDFTSFDFADANDLSDGKNLQDDWKSMKYDGIDKIYNGGTSILKPNKNEKSKFIKQKSDMDKTIIQIPTDKKFRLENEAGEYLEYEGQSYTSNMNISDYQMTEFQNNTVWEIMVDKSNLFKLTKADNGCQLVCSTGDKVYAVTADGAKGVTITSKGINVIGSKYKLNVITQSGRSETEYSTIDASVQGNCEIYNDEDKTLHFDGESKNIILTKYKDYKQVFVKGMKEITKDDIIINFSENNNKNNNGESGAISPTKKKLKQKRQKISIKKVKIYSFKKLKKKKVVFKLKAKTSGNGKLTYKITGYPQNGKKYINITKKGKVTLKKRIPKGIYKISVMASETSKYYKAKKNIKIKVK